MERRGLSRRLAVIDVPLDRLRAAGKEAGGSVNDAFLASLTGGLRLYHADAGLAPETLPIAFPVSLRRADDPLGGNRFAGARIAGPVGAADPRDRIRLIRERVLEARDEPALDFMALLSHARTHMDRRRRAVTARRRWLTARLGRQRTGAVESTSPR